MTKTELAEQARRLLRAIEDDVAAAPTLAELWPSYWQTEGQHLRSAARTMDAWNVLSPVIGADGVALGDRHANTVTAEIVEEVRQKIKGSPTRFRRPPRPATVNRHLIVLRRILNWACEQRKLSHNPLRLTLERENNVRQTAIKTEEEFQRLLECCDPLNKVLCLLFYDSGLRRMEGIELQRHQVIREANGGAWVTLFEVKNGQARWVPITKRTMQALDALPNYGSYYFMNPETKKPYGKRYLYELFQRAVIRSGLQAAPGESIGYHVLRHSFVRTRRAIDHIPESTIMSFTGHKTRIAFQRYGIVDPGEMQAVVATVESRLAQRIGPKQAPSDAVSENKLHKAG